MKDFDSVLNSGTIQKENKGIASFQEILYSTRSSRRAKVTTWEAYGWELSSAFS
jgi:hypothetical protein